MMIESDRFTLLARYKLEMLAAQLNTLLIDLKMLDDLQRLLRYKLKLYGLIDKDLQGQLESGKAIYGRFSDIDIKRTDIQQRLNQLDAERNIAQHKLIELVGEVPDIPTPIIHNRSWDEASSKLYPVLIAQEQIRLSASKVKTANSLFKPSYGIQALYKQRESSASFSGDDWFSIQASISVPLWANTNQKPKLASAEAEYKSALHMANASKRHWKSTMDSLQTEKILATENIRLLNTKRQSIQQMSQAIERNYRSGATTLEAVIHSQLDLAEMEIKLLQEENKFTKNVIESNQHILDFNSLSTEE